MADLRIVEHTLVDDRGHEVYVIPPDSADIFVLSSTGADTWRAISEAGSVTGAVEALAVTYELSPDDLQRDLRTYLGDLESSGALAPESGRDD